MAGFEMDGSLIKIQFMNKRRLLNPLNFRFGVSRPLTRNGWLAIAVLGCLVSLSSCCRHRVGLTDYSKIEGPYERDRVEQIVTIYYDNASPVEECRTSKQIDYSVHNRSKSEVLISYRSGISWVPIEFCHELAEQLIVFSKQKSSATSNYRYSVHGDPVMTEWEGKQLIVRSSTLNYTEHARTVVMNAEPIKQIHWLHFLQATGNSYFLQTEGDHVTQVNYRDGLFSYWIREPDSAALAKLEEWLQNPEMRLWITSILKLEYSN